MRMTLLGLLSVWLLVLGGCTHQVAMSELPKTATFESVVITGNLQVDHPILCTGCVDTTNITDGAVRLIDLVNQECPTASVVRGWSAGTLRCVTVGGGSASGWSLSGNAGTHPETQFLGTIDNQPVEIRVGNQHAWHAEPNETSPNLIGGASINAVIGEVAGATITGGGESTNPQRVTGNFGTVGGGANNTASTYGTVSGGASNTASGSSSVVAGGAGNTASSSYATVSGGTGNTANGIGSMVGGGLKNSASDGQATVSGGFNNTASNAKATVAGGETNVASGSWSTVPGGHLNTAAGDYSLAAGLRAKAIHTGAFVWADSTDDDFSSTIANQFSVRASGGARILSNSQATVGVLLAPGGNSWSVLSDRALKEHMTPVDGQLILQKLSLIPITQWNLKSQDASIRHIGPVAQDFYAAFGLGESDHYISSSDIDGIALVSIQALFELLLEKNEQIQQLTSEIQALRQRLDRLETLVQEMRR